MWLPLAHPPPGIQATTQACALIRNQTGYPLVCRPVLDPLSYTSQGTSVLIKREAEGLYTEEGDEITEGRGDLAGFDREGPAPGPKNVLLDAGKGQETEFLSRP